MRDFNSELSEAEEQIKEYWNDIKRHLLEGSHRWGLAGVYKEDVQNVQKDLEKIQSEALKLEKIFTKLLSYYKTNPYYKANKHEVEKVISDIESLIFYLKKIKESPDWIKAIFMELQNIILEVENIKIDSDVHSIILTIIGFETLAKQSFLRGEVTYRVPPMYTHLIRAYADSSVSAREVE